MVDGTTMSALGRRSLIISLLNILFVGCFSCRQTSPVSLDKEKIYIAAHRGGYEKTYQDKAPENSIANIRNAINHGIEIYESDVRRTSDGQFVIMHDPTLDRTTNGSGVVAKQTREELAKFQLTYNNGELTNEKIPFIEDFISKGNGNIIFKIDYKAPIKYLNELIETLQRQNLYEFVILRFSYNKEITKELNRYNLDDIPHVLFRVETLPQFIELQSNFNPRMISIITRDNTFSKEHLQIIQLASEQGLLIEAHTFHDNKEEREEYWAEQIKLPITIFHTKKPLLFQDFLKKKNHL